MVGCLLLHLVVGVASVRLQPESKTAVSGMGESGGWLVMKQRLASLVVLPARAVHSGLLAVDPPWVSAALAYFLWPVLGHVHLKLPWSLL